MDDQLHLDHAQVTLDNAQTLEESVRLLREFLEKLIVVERTIETLTTRLERLEAATYHGPRRTDGSIQ